MKLLLILVVIFSLTSLSLGFENPEMKGNVFRKLFQSVLKQSSPDDKKGRVRRQNMFASMGHPEPFCDMFGCKDCVVAPGAVCCTGYLYDERSKECRIVVKT
ncbi:hypothetical protein TNIN_271021 [Trichonephila inaurata madagascariensis]|uniref:Uncharacterized protein n=1 Tax=Trichonephila inaurata madagascariensis TaxID=2747483 RepID=A0A8X6WLL8_9ARAC|nr:hypothetical protein TNIN_271021 [Trichonephila inaurata madagascariensis]